MGLDDLPVESVTAIIVAGFSMGIAGSLHCIGMCGPLAIAVSQINPTALFHKLIYNSGRIFTYLLLGIITGLLGFALGLTSAQKFISLSLGLVLVVLGLSGFSLLRIPYLNSIPGRFTNWLKLVFSKWLKRRNTLSTLILGFLNGLLPCGLTYLALAYTLTLTNSYQAGLFMVSFGFGTLPAMVGIPIVAGLIGSKYSPILKKFNTVILITLGVLLIWRSYLQFHSGMMEEMAETAVVAPIEL